MATETFKTTNKTTVHIEKCITFQTAQQLAVGQEVYISGNNTVSERTLGTQFPIGVVDIPSLANETNVVVRTGFSTTQQAVAKGGALSAGAFVKPNGNLSNDELPEYVATASGDNAYAIVLSGGALDSIIYVGVLATPYRTA